MNNTIGEMYGKKNTHGEDVKKLDIVANNLFIQSLENGGNCAGIVSEEKEKVFASYVSIIFICACVYQKVRTSACGMYRTYSYGMSKK